MTSSGDEVAAHRMAAYAVRAKALARNSDPAELVGIVRECIARMSWGEIARVAVACLGRGRRLYVDAARANLRGAVAFVRRLLGRSNAR